MSKQDYSSELLARAAKIQLLIMDVDGVLSDGKVYYTNGGEEIKNFNIKDGLGIKLLHQNHIKTAIITGRQSDIVARRAAELGITSVFQGKSNKRDAFQQLLEQHQLEPSQVAHVGDDLPDLPLMQLAGLGIAVSDANWFVKHNADWTTPSAGGQGAVRDIAELLLSSRNLLEQVYQDYLTP